MLTKIGKETSLRYGSHLITTSNLIAVKRKANVVAIQDVQRAYKLFYDQARSVKVDFHYKLGITYPEANGCYILVPARV